MRLARTRVALAIGSVATLGLLAAPAPAGKVTKAKLKVAKVTATGAKGTLKSPNDACERRRKVVLQYADEYSPLRVGSAKTNRRGRWKTRRAIAHRGVFYATAKRVKRGKTKCARAESKGYRFE